MKKFLFIVAMVGLCLLATGCGTVAVVDTPYSYAPGVYYTPSYYYYYRPYYYRPYYYRPTPPPPPPSRRHRR